MKHSPLHQQLDDHLGTMLAALGLPFVTPEPEVARATLARCRHRSLASIIVALLTEHEPLLRAEQDGETVIVREIGDSGVMQFTIGEKE